MAMDKVDRKVALLRIGKSHTDIARECGVDRSVVSHVIAGDRWSGPQSRKVMHYITKTLGLPMEHVFPGSDRRKDPRPFVGEGAAA
jgi:hypothetical protein